MFKTFKTSIGVIIGVFLTVLFSNAEAKLVEAKGLSEIEDGKTVEARKVALENAKRAAVEQVLGSFIRARTDVNNFLLSKDQTYSSTAGQIDQYEIIFDDINANGAYEVVIKADVRVDIILDKAAELQAIYGWNKKPRVTVRIDDSSNNTIAAKQARAQLQEKLLREGFDVFDESEPVFAGFSIELLVSAMSHEDEYQGIKLVSNELSISYSVTRVGDNQVLASRVGTDKKAGLNKNKAFESIAEEVTDKEWPRLRRQIMTFWQKEQATSRNILMSVEGVYSLQDANQFSERIQQAIPAIMSVEITKVDGGMASFVFTYKGWVEQLYEELIASKYAQTNEFEINGVKGNKISATLL